MNLFSWIIRLICLFSNLRQLICLITQRKSIGTVIPLLQLQFDKIREGQRLSLFLPDEGDRERQSHFLKRSKYLNYILVYFKKRIF